MIEIYLLRHAQTEYNAHQKFIGGRSNHIHLSELGQEQAHKRAVDFRVRNESFDKVFCSSAIRARETLDAVIKEVSEISREPITYHDELNELSQGDWEGQDRYEILTDEQLAEINSKVPYFKAPNGESHHDAEVRMMEFVNNIIADHSEGRFLIVGHGLAFKCLLQGLLKIDPKFTYKLGCDNVSLTKLRYEEKRAWFLDYMNQK